MAVAFDAVTDGGYNSGSGNLTWSHTCTGSNRVLLVGIMGAFWAQATWPGPSDYVTGVTYNGVALTVIKAFHSGFGGYWSHLYVLIAPDTGAHNVVISISSAQHLRAVAVSYTGAQQSAQPNAFNWQAAGTAMGTLVTTTVANCLDVCFEQGGLFGGSVTSHTGTARMTPAGTEWWLGDNALGAAGSHNFVTDRTGGVMSMHIVAALAPAGAVTETASARADFF